METKNFTNETKGQFIPTQYELAVLAEHYMEESLGIRFFWEWSGCVGETRRVYYADERMAMIEDLIGEKALDEAVEGVREKYQRLYAEFERDKAEHRMVCGCGEASTSHHLNGNPLEPVQNKQ